MEGLQTIASGEQILILEDDPVLAQGLALNLELNGYKYQHAPRVQDALKLMETQSFALAVVDVGLPDGSGFDFCREVRKRKIDIPLVILTAQTDEDSVVEGLEAGANDYVKKPYSNKEIIARIRAFLRKVKSDEQVLKFEGLEMNLGQRKVFYNSKDIDANRREFELLRIFMLRPGIVFTRESIISQLGTADDISDRTIDSHISHLRAKLKSSGAADIKIRAEYGVGYRLTKDV